MAENFERVGVETVVEGIAKFERDIGKYNAALEKMWKVTKHSATVIYKQTQHIKALEKTAFAVAKELKKVQASEQAVAQSTKVATERVKNFTVAQGESLTLMQKVSLGLETEAEQMERLNKVVEEGIARAREREAYRAPTVRELVPVVGVAGPPIQPFESPEALVAATTGWRNLARGIAQAAQMQQRQEEVQKKQTEALKKQAGALGGTIKRLALYAIGIRAAYSLISKFRRALMDGLKTLYENTAEYKRLTTAVDQFKIALAAAIVPADSAAESMTKIAEAVEWFNMALLKASGTLRANVGLWGSFFQMGADGAAKLIDLARGIETTEDDIRSLLAQPFITWMETFNSTVESGTKAMEEAGDAAADYSSQIKSMISVMRRWEQASAAIAAKAGEIETAYQQAAGVALGDLAVSQMEMQADLADTITGIQVKAAKDREQAIRDSQLNIERTVKQGLDRLAKMEEQHALQRIHVRQRFNLSQIQSERIYQYTRYKLVAEGDVLAIEDLDERHELEQEAAEENFDLQQQQAQAMFDVQLKHQKKALEETVVAMGKAMTEQLRMIDEREQEEIDAARAAAEEKEAAAKEAYASALVDAEAAAIEQREAQEAEQQALLESTTQTLADMVTNTDLTTQQVLDAWHAVNGPDQALDQMVAELVARNEAWTDTIGEAWGVAADTSLAAARRLTDGWATSLGLITANALAAAAAVASIGSGAGAGVGGYTPYPRPRRRQYGGEDVVSTPTTFVAGEAGPERVVVQPLSSIGGGAASMGWRGGPIPVHGSGQMEGLDLSGIGDAVAQGLMLEMNKMLTDYRGQRGR